MSSQENGAEAGGSRLEVRLAANDEEIIAAQALRYRVFYEEMGAKPSAEMAAKQSDFDPFDDICDHLLVLDPARGSGGRAVVGTYRLIRREVGEAHGKFYTASEYDIAKILDKGGKFMELGRSCVDVDYRTGTTMQVMWSGIANYVWDRGIELMFGCASLPGTDPAALATQLSYLHHHHLAPEEIRPRALPDLYVDMNLADKDSLNPRRALASLPPLIKGYLRLGGFVGDGAVIDHQFNTTDVCVMVKTELVTAKYAKHYDRTGRDVSGQQ
ncbi:GNAT family N-acetyltransferase [Magnetospirillum sulfuroxidans]|uniref:L-ornithine N(alpha)-acyltransferase n=1 Tax=Magnetospirillum sulfuroxidans TaxID=611300 RepID=A0ABS5IEV4_9PROT|nr:GNAT family N-acyltransferase [Magnetospirillum sulfuroxidans]MBR9972943.1 GNAT family N-acetyltransferase [Magnetospirillum sulfuroxidans]